MKKKRVITLALSLLAAFTITLGASTPASAAWQDCPTGQFCGWSGSAYTGTLTQFTYSATIGHCTNLSAGTNNTWTSIRDDIGSPNIIYMYNSSNCLYTGEDNLQLVHHGDLYDVAATLNNKISSFEVVNPL